ncbi:unnamed protein product [Staurois parvus]|uniref:Uncharacterized protein n=1 Tax=Staurois parvus TaxID=386267 RepID=A0ABN9DWB1_9NEOB|nr:unnamed protein product [Staurois parvus]
MSARSCDQLCPITADHIAEPVIGIPQRDMCTDHQGTDDHPSSATCQCPSMPPVSAHPCHLPVPISTTSMPHISAYQCSSMPHISAHLSCLSVSPISASQCHLSMPVSACQ